MKTIRIGSAAALAALLMTIGCTPTPDAPNPATPAPPTITYFRPTAAPGTSPALVTFEWHVSDPNSDDLTCQIDIDGDLATDLTIRSCQGAGSTNVSLEAVDGLATQHTATLTVDDGVEVDGTVGSDSESSTVTINPGPSEPFDITLVGVDDLDTESAADFVSAADRWQDVIVSGLPDVDGTTLGCTAPDGSPLPTAIDDVVIYVKIQPIDGPGSILGNAGPTCITLANELTVVGEMTFDSEDVADMKTDGTFESVILHEMGHVLGIGTLWDTSGESGVRRLLAGAGGSDPKFVGAAATAEWGLLKGSADLSGVPVENTGGAGTADSHWRESIFNTELMTGWMDSTSPMSAMTIASLADLGYHVDLSAADPYTLAGAAVRRAQRPASELRMLRPPVEVSGTP